MAVGQKEVGQFGGILDDQYGAYLSATAEPELAQFFQRSGVYEGQCIASLKVEILQSWQAGSPEAQYRLSGRV